MNYIEIEISGKTYKLRLSTRSCVALEKALGCNPLQVFMDIDDGKLPKLTELVIILHTMLQQYNHGISLDKAYDLFDEYLADGHNMFDIVPIFVEVFQAAGFINKANEEESSKN